ncbi:hypothetical protein FA048_08105 [Pedobacter polaris]|uniref:Uncharacterized protein n=1 Tax=Pedobacter polaris TaxID=2571273 RepID=A0A4U1CR46_9SPHI|nr:hypothetical protein [Pedobacter polaris]TKC10154.1 hypothetical protein FA048_08105 [Pedobacter polaris]
MALYDGKNIKGSIGKLSFRKRDKKTTTIQSNPGKGTMKQTPATKKSASLFGSVVSPLAKHIRHNLQHLVNGFYDIKMVNRMNSDIAIIINQHLQEDRQIVFNQDSFNRLNGFEFNTKSLLIDSLLISPKLSFENSQVQLTFPALKVAKDLKFRVGSNKVMLQIQPVFFCLAKGLWLKPTMQTICLEKGQAITAIQNFNYSFPKGTTCLFGIGLVFFNGSIAINDKIFNPAGICASAYNEGTIDETELTGWFKMGL